MLALLAGYLKIYQKAYFVIFVENDTPQVYREANSVTTTTTAVDVKGERAVRN